jgi:ribonucleoside-diphosphate reductase alpha chain
MATMTGAGIGVWYGDIRPGRGAHPPHGRPGRRADGLMRKTNDGGRELLQGGNRRCAIWAGLPWWHPDIFKFIESQGLAGVATPEEAGVA